MSCTTSVYLEQVSLSRRSLSIVPVRGGPEDLIFSHGPAAFKPMAFAAGRQIFGPKTRRTSVWLLLSGIARLVHTKGLDSSRSSVLIHRGELVGLTETLAAVHHSAILEAVSPCVLQRMDIDDLLVWLKWKPDAGLELLRSVAADLSAAHFRSVKLKMCDHYHRRKVNQDLGLS